MTKATTRRSLAIAAAISLIWVLGADEASARNPEKVFRGQIVLAKSSIPTSAKSKNAYIKKLKKLRKKKFWEQGKKGSEYWKIHYAAFFRKKLNDLEITVKLYDITDGSKKLVNTYEQWLPKRGERSVISSIKLTRDEFGVNKRILMVVETRGYILSSTKFTLMGKAEKYSGEVDFSEEETKAKD